MLFLEFVQTLGFLIEEASREEFSERIWKPALCIPYSIRFEILQEFCFNFLPRLGVGERVYGTGSDRGLRNSAVSSYTDICPEMLMLPLAVHVA